MMALKRGLIELPPSRAVWLSDMRNSIRPPTEPAGLPMDDRVLHVEVPVEGNARVRTRRARVEQRESPKREAKRLGLQ